MCNEPSCLSCIDLELSRAWSPGVSQDEVRAPRMCQVTLTHPMALSVLALAQWAEHTAGTEHSSCLSTRLWLSVVNQALGSSRHSHFLKAEYCILYGVKREKQPSKKMLFCVAWRAEPLFNPDTSEHSASQGTSKPSERQIKTSSAAFLHFPISKAGCKWALLLGAPCDCLSPFPLSSALATSSPSHWACGQTPGLDNRHNKAELRKIDFIL